MTLSRRVATSLLLVGLGAPALTGCTDSAPGLAHGTLQPSQTLQPSEAVAACQAQLDGATQFDVGSVESLESLGPRPVPRATDGPFAAYAPKERVAMCLTPNGDGSAAVWGIVLSDPDFRAVRLWTQTPDDRFIWPI